MAPLIDNFDQQLTSVYDSALASGELIFTASETHKSKETEYDIEVQRHTHNKPAKYIGIVRYLISLLLLD